MRLQQTPDRQDRKHESQLSDDKSDQLAEDDSHVRVKEKIEASDNAEEERRSQMKSQPLPPHHGNVQQNSEQDGTNGDQGIASDTKISMAVQRDDDLYEFKDIPANHELEPGLDELTASWRVDGTLIRLRKAEHWSTRGHATKQCVSNFSRGPVSRPRSRIRSIWPVTPA